MLEVGFRYLIYAARLMQKLWLALEKLFHEMVLFTTNVKLIEIHVIRKCFLKEMF